MSIHFLKGSSLLKHTLDAQLQYKKNLTSMVLIDSLQLGSSFIILNFLDYIFRNFNTLKYLINELLA